MKPAPASDGKIAAKLPWFQRPWAVLVSWLFGIIGTIWGFLSFVLSVQTPELTYAQQPTQAVLVRSGELSRLTITYDGAPITTDIYATQVAFWNAGNRTIRREHLLRPIMLSLTSSGLRLLEAKSRFATREVVGLKLAPALPHKVQIEFDILEPGDGGIIQLIYSGGPEIDFTVSGVIEGQRELSKVRIPKSLEEREYSPGTKWGRLLRVHFPAAMSVVVAVLMGFVTAESIRRVRAKRLPLHIALGLFLSSGLLAWVVVVIWKNALSSLSLGPPFPF